MKKLTRRAYNRKIMMFGAAIFMSVAMISTGFAAWLISSADPVELDAPVTVEVVTDQTVKITVAQLDENGAWKTDVAGLNFDAVKTDGSTPDAGKGETRAKDLVLFTGDGDGEQLVLPLSGTITNTQILSASEALTITITLPEGIKNAIDNGYLATPDGYSAGVITKKFTQAEISNGNFDATVTFAWGTKFGGVNPCYYYDSAAAADKDAATVVAEMTAFSNMIHETDALATEAKVGTIAVVITPNLA